MSAQRGQVLVLALVLLTLITVLGLASAAAARIELQLANNLLFRENAANAASAGIEYALSHLSAMSSPSDFTLSGPVAAHADPSGRYEISARFLGPEQQVPQRPSDLIVAEHFEVVAIGYAARGAVDRQRVHVARLVPAATTPEWRDCEPEVPGQRCQVAGRLLRLSWQRLPPP